MIRRLLRELRLRGTHTDVLVTRWSPCFGRWISAWVSVR